MKGLTGRQMHVCVPAVDICNDSKEEMKKKKKKEKKN